MNKQALDQDSNIKLSLLEKITLIRSLPNDSLFEPKAYAWGVLIGTSAVIVIFVGAVISGWLTIEGPESANAKQLLESFFGSVGSSTCEEVIFRGFLCGWFPSFIGQYASAVPIWGRRIMGWLWFFAVTVFWAGSHKTANSLEMFSILAAGLMFLITFKLSRNIFLPMGMHMGWNFGLGIFNLSGDTKNWFVTRLTLPSPYWDAISNLVGVAIMGIGVWWLLNASSTTHNQKKITDRAEQSR